MHREEIEAVFENGIFRPLQPVQLPERQRITLVLPAREEAATNRTAAEASELPDDVGYEPLPLAQLTTIRVRLKQIDDFGPLHYPIEVEDQEQE
jgi:predicted DNA-binding antitoxin AbrB/MazE fold protein